MFDTDQMIFRDLATVYQERQLQPAESKGERKISGRRSYYSPRLYLKVLTGNFGRRHISEQVDHLPFLLV